MLNVFMTFSLASIFLAPWFAAAGGLLIGIPILIHILNRRRYKIVRWAAMAYLLQAMRKNRRRLKFEQWILLATRCALLALLGMALARPLGCDNSTLAALAGQRNGLHVIVIDNSYSMAYQADRPNAPTHLDQAKIMARSLIGRLASGSESVILITAGNPATAVIAEPSFNLDACRSAVDRIEQSYGSTDLQGALSLAMQLVKDKSHQPVRTLEIFTDGTRSAWEGPRAEVLKELGPQLARTFKITHYNLGRPDQWNQAILDLKPGRNLVTTKFTANFLAAVKGYGNGSNPTLQWMIDQNIVSGGGKLQLDAEAKPQLLSDQAFKVGGPHVVTANLIGDDHLKVDNTRSRIVDVTSDLKVLIVEGERGLGFLSGSGAFLNAALAPPDASGKPDSFVSPEVISDLELNNKVLGQYRAVVLTNVSQISEAQAQQLEDFVKQGGSLMIFMGEQVNKENYNSTLLAVKSDGEHRYLLPGKLIKQVSSDQTKERKPFLFDFKPMGVLHPYLTDFRGEVKSGLDTAQIFKYWQVQIDPATHAEHILDYLPAGSGPAVLDGDAAPITAASGAPHADPAITVQAVGLGRVVFVSTTANADWTSLPAKPAYVTLMNELLSGSVSSGDSWMNLMVGSPLKIPPYVGIATAPTLVDPAKHAVPIVDSKSKDGMTLFGSAPLDKPGIYMLSTGTRTIPIAVNVPSADEADVRTLPNEAIKKALGGVEINLEGDSLPPDAVLHNSGADLGWFVMCLVFALAAGECFMAMSFGHYKKKV